MVGGSEPAAAAHTDDPPERVSPTPGGPVGALDCGTNSTRLLVCDPDGITRVRLMRITRLGQGVDATGDLDQAAIERTVAVLEEYRKIMDDTGVQKARLVTTSAVRDARNGEAFLRAASEAVGFAAELISGEEEGRLAYAGATAGLGASTGDDMVVDIGGGSTEIVLQRDGIVEAYSMNIGCVRLTERFLAHDPANDSELAAMHSFITESLQQAVVALPVLANLRRPTRLLGLAGSVTTVAALALGLETYDRDAVHHSILTKEAVAQWSARLAREPAAERATRGVIAPGRVDVIVGGASVLDDLMHFFDLDACVVSETDILDGIALSLLA